jgi:uncharacterized membrane protein YeaQ/YmgE (transglycosylase-associated protein family)
LPSPTPDARKRGPYNGFYGFTNAEWETNAGCGRGFFAPGQVKESAMSQYLADHGWLGWILIGLLAGIIAKAIMPGRDPAGCLVTIALGICGALLAGFLGQQLGWYESGEGAGFIAAVVGALILLFVYRLVAGRR